MQNKSILTLAAAMMMASAVFAGPGCGPGPHGAQGCGPQVGAGQCSGTCHTQPAGPLAALELNDEQSSQIDEIHEATRLAMIDLRAAEKKAEFAMQQAMKDGESLSVINRKIEALTETRAEIMKKRAATHAAVREVLTPEQREKFDELAPMGLGAGNGRGMSDCKSSGNRHSQRGHGHRR